MNFNSNLRETLQYATAQSARGRSFALVYSSSFAQLEICTTANIPSFPGVRHEPEELHFYGHANPQYNILQL